MNCLLNYEQLKVSSTAVLCVYLCVEDVYCLSLTLLVSGMCFEKTNEYNSAKGNTSSKNECKTRIVARKGT